MKDYADGLNFSTHTVQDSTAAMRDALDKATGIMQTNENNEMARNMEKNRRLDKLADARRVEARQRIMDQRYEYQKKLQEEALNRQLAKEAEAKRQDQILRDTIKGVGDTYDVKVDVPATSGNIDVVNDIKARNAIRAKHLEELNGKVGRVVDKFAERYNDLLGKVKDPKQLEAEKKTYNIVKGFYPESQWTDAEKKAYTPTGMTKEQAYEQAMKDSGMDAIVADYTNPNLAMQDVPKLVEPVAAHTNTVTKKMDNAMKAAALNKAIRNSDLTGTNMMNALARVKKLYPVKNATLPELKMYNKQEADKQFVKDVHKAYPKDTKIKSTESPEALKLLLKNKLKKTGSHGVHGAQKFYELGMKSIQDRGDDDSDSKVAWAKYVNKHKEALDKMSDKDLMNTFRRFEGKYLNEGTGMLHGWFGWSPVGDALNGFTLADKLSK